MIDLGRPIRTNILQLGCTPSLITLLMPTTTRRRLATSTMTGIAIPRAVLFGLSATMYVLHLKLGN